MSRTIKLLIASLGIVAILALANAYADFCAVHCKWVGEGEDWCNCVGANQCNNEDRTPCGELCFKTCCGGCKFAFPRWCGNNTDTCNGSCGLGDCDCDTYQYCDKWDVEYDPEDFYCGDYSNPGNCNDGG